MISGRVGASILYSSISYSSGTFSDRTCRPGSPAFAAGAPSDSFSMGSPECPLARPWTQSATMIADSQNASSTTITTTMTQISNGDANVRTASTMAGPQTSTISPATYRRLRRRNPVNLGQSVRIWRADDRLVTLASRAVMSAWQPQLSRHMSLVGSEMARSAGVSPEIME
jgi:hypothetical protein